MGMVAIFLKWPKKYLHMKFQFKQPSDFWESKWQALDERSAWPLVLSH